MLSISSPISSLLASLHPLPPWASPPSAALAYLWEDRRPLYPQLPWRTSEKTGGLSTCLILDSLFSGLPASTNFIPQAACPTFSPRHPPCLPNPHHTIHIWRHGDPKQTQISILGPLRTKTHHSIQRWLHGDPKHTTLYRAGQLRPKTHHNIQRWYIEDQNTTQYPEMAPLRTLYLIQI